MKNKTLKTMTCAAMATTLSISPFLSLTEAYAMSQAMESMVQEEQSTLEEEYSDQAVVKDEMLGQEESLQKDDLDAEMESGLVFEAETEAEVSVESHLDIEPQVEEGVLINNSETEVDTTGVEVEQEMTEKNAQIFNLSEWIYTENAKFITITAAKNARTSVYIPGEYNGKQVVLNNLKVFPAEMTHLVLKTVNGKKVGLVATDISSSFYYNTKIQSLDLSGLDTSKVTDMGWLFGSTSKLTYLNLSGWNTSQVVDMGSMFCNVSSLESLDLKSFNTAKVTDMSSMFDGMKSLKSLNISSFNTKNVTKMNSMFNGLESLEVLNVKHFNTAKVKSMAGMFYKMKSLKSLDLSSFNTANVTDMSTMFGFTESLTTLNISSFNTSNVVDMDGMFMHMKSLKSLNLKHFDTQSVERMSSMFQSMTSLTSLNISSFNTSNVEVMSFMFQDASSLTSLDLRHFDTGKVFTMAFMFKGMTNLKELKVDGWDTSKVVYMDYMFSDVESLTTLDLSSFETTSLKDIVCMFRGMPNLTVLDLSNFHLNEDVDGLTTDLFGKPYWSGQILQPLLILTEDAQLRLYENNEKVDRLISVVSYPKVTATTTNFKGIAEAGTRLTLSVNGKVLASTTVGSSKSYNLTIPKQKAGTVLTLEITTPKYTTTKKTITVLNELNTFTVTTAPTPSTTAIYGTGVPGAKVSVYSAKGGRLAITTVNSKGNYKLVIPKQSLNTVLTFKQTKANYITKVMYETVLNELKTFTTPHLTTSSTTISGKGVPGAKVGIYTSAGKRLAITTVNSKGNYKLTIPKQKAGTKLVIKQAKSGYATLSKDVTVLNQFKTFTYDTPTTATTAIYGKGVAGAKVGIYTSAGKRLAITTVNSKGNYKLTIPKQKAGTKLVLKQAKSGYLTLSKEVKVLNALKTFTHSAVKASSKTITGKGVAGAKVGVYDKNGKRLAITTVNSKGNYKLTIPKQKTGTKLVLKQAKSGYLTLSKNITVVRG